MLQKPRHTSRWGYAMSARFPTWMAASAALVLLAAGCGKEKPESGMDLLPAAYTDTTAEFPHLRYRGGQESLNDRCPVRKAKLNLRLPPVYVNGHPVGFC